MIRHMSKKIDIIKLYSGDYNSSYSGREIARALKLNPQTALNHLNELVKCKIMLFKKKGRNKEYYLNKDNLVLKQMINISEIYKSIEAMGYKELKILIRDIIRYCESIVLFGSFASGRADKESDIDLVVIGAKDKEKILKIKRNFPREVNVEFISYDGLEQAVKQKKALAIEISKNHVIFGETNKIVEMFL